MSDKPERLDEFLRRAHDARPELELSDEWQAGLMREIGELSRKPRRRFLPEEPSAVFAKLLFRFAGAGAFVAAGLLIYAHLYGPDLDRQAAGIVLEQPVAPAALESLIWS
ncbi:MAG: hypothetical protein ABIK12_09505 [Pseudomonadota bacterium]